MDPRSVVRRRVTEDPSPFSPSFRYCFPFTATPNSSQLIYPSFLVEREILIQLWFIHCIRSDARRILGFASFLLASPNALTFAFLLFSTNLSGTNHNHVLFSDPLLGRFSTCYGRLFASSVVAFRLRYQSWGSADIRPLPPRPTGISQMVSSEACPTGIEMPCTSVPVPSAAAAVSATQPSAAPAEELAPSAAAILSSSTLNVRNHCLFHWRGLECSAV